MTISRNNKNNLVYFSHRQPLAIETSDDALDERAVAIQSLKEFRNDRGNSIQERVGLAVCLWEEILRAWEGWEEQNGSKERPGSRGEGEPSLGQRVGKNWSN